MQAALTGSGSAAFPQVSYNAWLPDNSTSPIKSAELTIRSVLDGDGHSTKKLFQQVLFLTEKQ